MKRFLVLLGHGLARAIDWIRLPSLLGPLLRATARTEPLSSAEIAAASELLGDDALAWDRVRIAQGGLLKFVFRLNGNRAFTAWHTINLPTAGGHGRESLAIVVHELVHVLQYERVGTVYMGQALHAQATTGYGYGGPEGLRRDRAGGKRYRDYNREQQAQIVQDCFARGQRGESLDDYAPSLEELRRGEI